MENLTGRVRFRTTWRGKLILQVEYKVATDGPGSWYHRWRDATTKDYDITGKLQGDRV